MSNASATAKLEGLFDKAGEGMTLNKLRAILDKNPFFLNIDLTGAELKLGPEKSVILTTPNDKKYNSTLFQVKGEDQVIFQLVQIKPDEIENGVVGPAMGGIISKELSGFLKKLGKELKPFEQEKANEPEGIQGVDPNHLARPPRPPLVKEK